MVFVRSELARSMLFLTRNLHRAFPAACYLPLHNRVLANHARAGFSRSATRCSALGMMVVLVHTILALYVSQQLGDAPFQDYHLHGRDTFGS